MLKSISLENYKCFKDKTDIKIAPLTILCGVNSSGKSSIINSLLMQKQSYEDNSVSNNVKLNGDYVKCGKFNDVSFKKNNNVVRMELTYEVTKPLVFKKNKQKPSKADITAFKNLAKIFGKYDIVHFEINSSIALKKYTRRKYITDNILEMQVLTITATDSKNVKIVSSISLKHLQESQYLIRLCNIPFEEGGDLIEFVELKNAACYFENFNLINVYCNEINPKGTSISGLLANVYMIFKMNVLQYKNINYLTPLRVYPQRNYILDNEKNDVGISGEFTPHIMYKYRKSNIEGFIPPLEDRIVKGTSQIKFNNCVKQWMNYLQFGSYSLPESLETIQVNISEYNIQNVGFGISQVLPILVSGLIKKRNEILLLEQPEIHLHPNAQMCMADYLLSMAVNERYVIVETHSDHIINRVVRRMMEDDEINKIVRIYFIDQDSNGISSIEDINVDAIRGVLSNNENFFTQFASETEKIIYTGYRNKHKEG